MLDSDLAALYGVTTGNLNKAVTRNLDRFPPDFMFRLSSKEYRILRFQFGSLRHGEHSKYPPRAFDEQGVAMLSGVLGSPRAVRVNIAIMRAFVRLRSVMNADKELSRRLDWIERKLLVHGARLRRNAKGIGVVFAEIRRLMEPPIPPRRRIGFFSDEPAEDDAPTRGACRATAPREGRCSGSRSLRGRTA